MRNSLIMLALILISVYSWSQQAKTTRVLAYDDPFCNKFDSEGKCIACSCRYYFDRNRKCQQISDQCKTYDINTGKCLSCPRASILQEGVCTPLDGPYEPSLDQTVLVNPNCQTYNGEGNCKTCYEGYTFHCNDCLAPQNPSCFVGETIVNEKTRGFVQMRTLKIGEQIETMKKGQKKWSKIQGWLHKDQTQAGSYRKIFIKTGEWIGVSGQHNIAFTHQKQTYEYLFPKNQGLLNKTLYPSNASIISSQFFVANGKYAPSTSENSYLVFTPKTFVPVLAHDWAYLTNPESFEGPVALIFKVVKLFNGGQILDQNGVNIFAKWFSIKYKYLLV